MKPVARSKLMLNIDPNVHCHNCGFQPCVVPVLVATTLVDCPGKHFEQGRWKRWLVSKRSTGLCSTMYPPRTRQLDNTARDLI
jgi:hypothetical protein